MHNHIPLIATVAAAFGLALLFGLLAARLKLPALLGYLVAGVVIGPYTPGFVADLDISAQLAEIGVMLLMFGVGLHFSLDDLLKVRSIALPGAMLQIVVATALGGAVALSWGWSIGVALVFGLSLSVASTVVLLRALEARGLLDSMNGRIAVGWLVVEDLVMVLALVLLPPMAGWLGGRVPDSATGNVWLTLGVTVIKVAAFIVLMVFLGRRILPRFLWHVASTGSRELFTLCVVTAAIGIAYVASTLFGVSFALGAFFAGMMMRESEFSHRAAEESLPLQEAFSVLFFVSVGMLFNPLVILDSPGRVAVVVAIIMFGKSLAAAVLVLAFRYPLNAALTVSVSLAQIGEFSFILTGLGISLELLTTEGSHLVLAGAIISIALNPLLFAGVEPFSRWMRARSAYARSLDLRMDPLAELPMTTEEKYLSRQVVLVGYGRVGQRIGAALLEKGIPFVVAEQNRDQVDRLRHEGIAAVYGDAADPTVLVQAHIARAKMLVIAVPETFSIMQMVNTARTLNPQIEIIIRTLNEEESVMLEQESGATVFFSENEVAKNMALDVLRRYDNKKKKPAK